MAAAAGLVLLAGAAGGAAVQAFAPARTTAAISPTASGGATPISLTAADLNALEHRLVTSFGDRLGAVDARVQQVSTGTMSTTEFQGDRDALLREIQALHDQNESLANVIKLIYANADQVRGEAEVRNANLVGKFNNLQALVMGQLQQMQSK
jgi:hypothetical protein